MPAVAVVGEILGCSDFKQSTLFCRWKLVTGHHHWQVAAGATEGQTQVADVDSGASRDADWGHPVDVLYSCASVRGWPKLHLEVWDQDAQGRVALVGNGFCFVPTAPGRHKLECALWRPSGSFCDQVSSFFLGGYSRLRSPEVVFAPMDRFGLRATSVGVVNVELAVVLKGFEGKGVSFEKSAIARKVA